MKIIVPIWGYTEILYMLGNLEKNLWSSPTSCSSPIQNMFISLLHA